MKKKKIAKIRELAKKMFSILLVVAVLISQFSFPIWTIEVNAQGTIKKTNDEKYFYNQLSDDAKVFYKAMEDMLENGDFKKGIVNKEITKIDNLKEKLNAYADGSQDLLKEMGAARDAFMIDYPELFYVDFDYFSMRVTRDNAGMHLYIGTGRSDNYISKEFLKLKEDGTIDVSATEAEVEKAITRVESEMNSIVTKAQAGKTKQEKVKIAHDEIIRLTKYTYEYQTKHPYSVRTIYGVFGLGSDANNGNAVCEGYARALKSILDRLGIPAILVRGVYMDGSTPQEHMWVYVQIDKEWYGVDLTFDNTDKFVNNIEEVRSKYLLVSADIMRNHYPIGIISTSNKEFKYPDLYGGESEDKNNYSGVSNIVYKDANGLVIIDTSEKVTNEQDGTTDKVYHVSLNGKGFKKAAKEDGKYMIFNFWQEKQDADGNNYILPTDWIYPAYEETYQYYFQESEDGTYTVVMPRYLNGFQVGITDVAQEEEPSMDNQWDVFYKGGSEHILSISSDILTDREVSEFPAPYVKKTTPASTTKQRVGKTYDITVEYDQDMKLVGKLGYELKIYDRVYGYRTPNQEEMKYKIDELEFDGKRTITFKFTPSKLWSLDETIYIIQFTGIQGILSGEAPNTVSYVVANSTTGCIYQLRAMGVDMEAYGKPALMDDFDLADILDKEYMKDNGITDEMLQQYGDYLKNRLSLVTTSTTFEQEAMMEDLLDKELARVGENKVERTLDDTPGKTHVQMYNILLSLCTCQLERLKDGTKIKIMLGFPEGYGPNDAGVTFKAYHYKKTDDGTYKIEEIDCIVTELGLIIYVDSFSPYAIAALKATEEEIANTDKTVVINVSEGGNVVEVEESKEGKADTITTLSTNNKTKTFKVVAAKGYVIDGIVIGEDIIELPKGSKEYSFDLNYDELAKDNTMIKVAFVAESVHKAEKEAGSVPVVQPIVSVTSNNPDNNGNNGSNNAQTSMMDIRIYTMLAVSSLVGAIYLIRKKIA